MTNCGSPEELTRLPVLGAIKADALGGAGRPPGGRHRSGRRRAAGRRRDRAPSRAEDGDRRTRRRAQPGSIPWPRGIEACGRAGSGSRPSAQSPAVRAPDAATDGRIRVMSFVLGINNCFAVKRWPSADEWAPLIARGARARRRAAQLRSRRLHGLRRRAARACGVAERRVLGGRRHAPLDVHRARRVLGQPAARPRPDRAGPRVLLVRARDRVHRGVRRDPRPAVTSGACRQRLRLRRARARPLVGARRVARSAAPRRVTPVAFRRCSSRTWRAPASRRPAPRCGASSATPARSGHR